MSRPKGSTNQERPAPWPMNLGTKDRIDLLANIIVDKIVEDQKNGEPLLKKITASKPVHILRVFTDPEGNHGDTASIVIDDGRYVPSEDRPGIARELNTGESIFINDITSAEISVVHPQGEISFAGVGVVGAAWLLTKLRKEPIDSLSVLGGKIAVWQEGQMTWVRASLDMMPDWHHKEYSSPEEIEQLNVDSMKAVEHTMAWAWIDKSKGIVRARTFAADWDIPEAQGNGSGSMILATILGREIEIHHGTGSIIYAKPQPDNAAAVGGIVVEEKQIEIRRQLN